MASSNNAGRLTNVCPCCVHLVVKLIYDRMQNASEKFDTLIYPILIDLTELIGVLTIKILDLYYDVIPAYWQEFYFLV